MRPYLLDMPKSRDDMPIDLVAKALSHLNRYAGRGRFPISLATHQAELSIVVPKHLARAALMHDVSELWWGDVPVDAKRLCPEYARQEKDFGLTLFDWFGIQRDHMDELHDFDVAIRSDELRCAFPDYVRDHGIHPGFGIEFVPTDPPAAARFWHHRYRELFA